MYVLKIRNTERISHPFRMEHKIHIERGKDVMPEFTAKTLPKAVKKLFELNNYSVTETVQIHGAEIDLVARPKTDPFGSTVYIEVTVEYVDNDKYGKDVGKLAMINEVERDAKKLIISSRGFSLPVKERALATRIDTLTYEELFRKFEQFEPYISAQLGETELAKELHRLSQVYEEPNFSDEHGHERATTYLSTWISDKNNSGQWLLVTGEYGTGKTALTKVLQYRWLKSYQSDPTLPIPIRIELREFSSQFNARGLLHHFLDHNFLSHIPVDFVFSLIKQGRIVLILDGYDEMAQYLHSRERRACLEALAQLSSGGAKGILTSRPNYFTEAEELQMFDLLYKSLEHGQYFLGIEAKELLEKERQTDELLSSFIERHERILKDLTPEQTEALISRVLSDDAEGRQIVIKLLGRIFRTFDNSNEISLSGKPVIVSYLLEVVEGLKGTSNRTDSSHLTEWQVYKLIVDQLMMRDFKRVQEIRPDIRRSFLQSFAIFLSKRENAVVSEEAFRDMVAKEFRNDLTRFPKESQSNRLDQLFSDLRSSATLTRGGSGLDHGWRFSHNSLREYLVAESIINSLSQKGVIHGHIAISDAMRIFAASIEPDKLSKLVDSLAIRWKDPSILHSRGQFLNLLWDGLIRKYQGEENPYEICLKSVSGDIPEMNDISLSNMELSTILQKSDYSNSDFSRANLLQTDFTGANLENVLFTNSTLEEVDFSYTLLQGTSFSGAFLIDVKFSCSLEGADFTGVDPGKISISIESNEAGHRKIIDGQNALGYLQFCGAETDPIQTIYVLQHHKIFPVVDKILTNLGKQSLHQRRGLSQRGAAHQNVTLARDFVQFLENKRLLHTPKNRKDLVEVTDKGRDVFRNYIDGNEFSEDLLEFFSLQPGF